MRIRTIASALSAAALLAGPARADVTGTLAIDVDKPGHAIPPTFGGLMTEEINHSYDGGLFAELIRNRTFQDPAPRGGTDGGPAPHWLVVGGGTARLDRGDPVTPALPVSLRLELGGGTAGVANEGYWGVPVRPGTKYVASFWAKGGGGFAGPVTASLVTDEGGVAVAKAATKPITAKWTKYTVTLTTAKNAPVTSKAKFVLTAAGTGSVSFSLVSLFPPTYKNVPGGLRPDLMELMAGLKPAFIRLPGGNYLEGDTFPTRFDWKQMIGTAEQRPGHMGCWGYRSSDGFGLPQYLLWCRQLGAEPVLAVFAGYVLNHDHVNAGSPEMARYTQEALEEIEYVTGPATSEWGAKRAADGFPEPFPLRYVEIGNEDWFDGSGSYDGRFAEMAIAIRKRYPHLKIVATAPVHTVKPDLYDDHFYRSARQLMATARQYDPPAPDAEDPPLRFNGGGWNGRQPAGIQTFVGEWATQEGRPTPTLNAGLADAAFVMGLEQNADAVPMECYAPLLVNVNPGAWQWGTNLIGYDALTAFGSPSYWAQRMLAENRGDVALPASLQLAASTAPAPAPHGGIGVGTWHTDVEYKDIAVTGPDGRTLYAADLSKDGTRAWKAEGGEWRTADGVLRPENGVESESWAVAGDPSWTDYTVRLKARKLAGREGFLILWHAKDTANYHWWNVGGWGNTATRTERAESGSRDAYGPSGTFKVETGRWYDLRLEVSGNRVRGYVDGALVTDITDDGGAPVARAVATATYDTAGRAVLVKVVNTGDEPLALTIDLRGAGKVEPKATATVLTGDPKAVNSVAEPKKVAPKEEAVSRVSSTLRRTFPPHSLTVLRVKAAR